VLLYTLIDIIHLPDPDHPVVVIVQFVMYLLITFNVINMHNNFVDPLWRRAERDPRTDPQPDPPDHANTGGIDFSPMVLIIGLVILQKVLWASPCRACSQGRCNGQGRHHRRQGVR
jgi:YggT family protein